jgi:hypothetical protein
MFDKNHLKSILLLTVLTLIACGLFASPNPTHMPTPIQPTDPPAPPTPSPTPIRIPGVDDPVSLDEQNMELLVLGVDFEPNEQPARLKLVLKYGPPFNLTDAEWIARNSELTCGAVSYSPQSFGFYIGDSGRLEHHRLIFDVPENVNFSECGLHLSGDVEIPLASFSE